MVMPEQNVSNKELGQTEGVNHTHSAKGSWQQEKTASVTDRLLFGLYCRAHFSDATQERGDRALDYEMEYLIGGKNADSGKSKGGSQSFAAYERRRQSALSGEQIRQKVRKQ